MRILFDGDVRIEYGQAYVVSGGEYPPDPMGSAFAGQQNGLCGAAWPGMLFLVAGPQYGTVRFTVERHEADPRLDDEWADAVEASFRPATEDVEFVEWGGVAVRSLDLPPSDLRVRYCAREMDIVEANRYLLQFWPWPPGPDRVVKQTSEAAAYWHRWAREQPPPPPPPTPEQVAEAEREAARQRAEAALAFEARTLWGGQLPSDRVRRAGGNVVGLVALDRDLVEDIAATGPIVQRAIARWAVRRAYDVAGLSTVPWIAPALDALDHGRPLPPPFDDDTSAWPRLFADPAVPRTAVTSTSGGPRNISQQAYALPALRGAVEADPLRAAISALYAAAGAHGDQYPALFQAVRREFLS